MDPLGMESRAIDGSGLSVSTVLNLEYDRYGKERGRLNRPWVQQVDLKWDGWVPDTTIDENPIFDVDLYTNLWMTGMRSKGGTHGGVTPGVTTSYVWKFKVSYRVEGGTGHTTLAPVSEIQKWLCNKIHHHGERSKQISWLMMRILNFPSNTREAIYASHSSYIM